jgi:hypothetical protein
MGTKDVFMAVYAEFEDGVLTGFAMDSEALIGSLDGNVWDHEEGEWTREDGDHATAYRQLSDAITQLNYKIEQLNRKDLDLT